MTAARVALIGLLASGAGGCLLFTDTVNAPPVVEIEGPEQLHRGQEGMFSARVTDSTRGELGFVWLYGPACPEDLRAAEDPRTPRDQTAPAAPQPADPAAFVLKHVEPVASRCLWVIVTDAEGARSFASKTVMINDRKLRLNGPPQVHSNQPATFTAGYPEEPEAAARSLFSWAMARDGSCESAVVTARSSDGAQGAVSYLYERAQRADFCVAVAARDDSASSGPATLRVSSKLTAPVAAIRLVTDGPAIAARTPTGIFEPIRLAAAAQGEVDRRTRRSGSPGRSPAPTAPAWSRRPAPTPAPPDRRSASPPSGAGPTGSSVAVSDGAQALGLAPLRAAGGRPRALHPQHRAALQLGPEVLRVLRPRPGAQGQRGPRRRRPLALPGPRLAAGLPLVDPQAGSGPAALRAAGERHLRHLHHPRPRVPARRPDRGAARILGPPRRREPPGP